MSKFPGGPVMRKDNSDSPLIPSPRPESAPSAFLALFSHHPIPTWLADAKTHAILEVNSAAVDTYGFTRDELLALTLKDILPESGRVRVSSGGGQRFAGEWNHRRENGAMIEVLLDAYTAELAGRPVVVVQAQDIAERRRAEHLYRTIYEASPVGILSVDSGGRVIRANPAFQRVIGYTETELARMSFNDFTHPEDQEVGRDTLARLNDGTIRNARVEKRYVRKNGAVVWVSVMVSAIRDADRRLLSTVSIVEDITRRKQTEEALREREEQLRLYVDHSPAAIAMFDRDMRYLVVSRRWIEDYRLGEAPILGRSHYEIFPEITEAWKEVHRRCLAGAVEKCDEEPFHRSDGTIDWIRWEVRPWHQADGSVGGIVIFSEDISPRKQVEAALRESEERFRKAFMTSPDSININRLSDGRYVAINRGFTETMGYTEEDVSGKTSVELAIWENPEDRKRLVEQLSANGVVSNLEARFRTKDGKIKYGLMAASVIELGGVAHIMSSTHDVTERRRMEEQLRQAQKMETVGRLAGGVAHDFNNMLHVIISYVEMSLQKVEPGLPVHTYLQEVLRAARRSAEMTGQLLAFARKQTVSPRVLDLNECIIRSQKMIRGLVGEDIDLVWLPQDNLWEVKIDPGQLDQILANLAANARDAISGVGRLTIRTANASLDEAYCTSHTGSMPGAHVLLEVNDNGRGMDRETEAHLFEPFFTTKEVGKGTGLGLATIYGIVSQNGGSIDVESAPGAGTTFRIYLPKAEGARTVGGSDPVTPPPRGGAETILLVEDESGIVRLVTQQLHEMGYTVLSARSPEEALHSSDSHQGRIDLLITDVVMPQMYGRQLAERLIAKRPELKCLYMSGYTADIIANRGMLEEGVNFIAKPFSLAALAQKVKEALGK